MKRNHPESKRTPMHRLRLGKTTPGHKPNVARSFTRYGCKAPIVYEYYDPENLKFFDGFETGDAEVRNVSREGMCLALNHPMQPNSPVFIRSIVTGRMLGFHIHEGHHAEVRWCVAQRPMSRSGYLVGVRFYDPSGAIDLTLPLGTVADYPNP